MALETGIHVKTVKFHTLESVWESFFLLRRITLKPKTSSSHIFRFGFCWWDLLKITCTRLCTTTAKLYSPCFQSQILLNWYLFADSDKLVHHFQTLCVEVCRDWEGKQASGPMAPCCEKLWAISKKYGSLNWSDGPEQKKEIQIKPNW